MKAVLCPVCNGSGELPPCPGTYHETPCHGCAEWGSKGWLLVPEIEELPTPLSGGNDYTSVEAELYTVSGW